MHDADKLSLGLAAQYLGITTVALEALEAAGWIKATTHAASRIPIYLGVDLKRLKLAAPPETQDQKTQRRIRESREEVQAQIMHYTNELIAIQDRCTHPGAMKENKANTGNYDRSQDTYWKDCVCPDCGKRWMEDQ
jgi:hypothetical protein